MRLSICMHRHTSLQTRNAPTSHKVKRAILPHREHRQTETDTHRDLVCERERGYLDVVELNLEGCLVVDSSCLYPCTHTHTHAHTHTHTHTHTNTHTSQITKRANWEINNQPRLLPKKGGTMLSNKGDQRNLRV